MGTVQIYQQEKVHIQVMTFLMHSLDIYHHLKYMGVTLFVQVCVSVNIIIYLLLYGGVRTPQ